MLSCIDAGVDEGCTHIVARVIEQQHPCGRLWKARVAMLQTGVSRNCVVGLDSPIGVRLHLLMDSKERPVEVSVQVEQGPTVRQLSRPPGVFPLRGNRSHFPIRRAWQLQSLAFLHSHQRVLDCQRQLRIIEEALLLAAVNKQLLANTVPRVWG